MFTDSTLLRRALAADAIGSGISAVLLLSSTTLMAGLTGLSAFFIEIVSFVLFPFAAWVGYLALQRNPSRTQVWCVIGVNALWVLESALLLFNSWAQLTLLGVVLVIAQAIAVGVIAELEYVGIRRAPRAATPA